MQAPAFDQRIYTLPTFLSGVADLFHHLDDLSIVIRERRIDRAFAEKLMLAVTEVNQCRYCKLVHTQAALRAGVTKQELGHLSAGNFEGLPPNEGEGLAFAQHYAEQGGRYDEAAWQRLVEVYGVEAAREILVYLRAISFGNLLGNTFDALLSRLRGRPATTSSLAAEVLILTLGVAGVPAGIALWALSRLVSHVIHIVCAKQWPSLNGAAYLFWNSSIYSERE